MKTIIFFSIVCVMAFSNSCIQAQNTIDENGVEKMIKDFYTKHSNIWENTPTSVPANVLHEKLDSLAQKYCTKKIRNEAKSWFVNGQDLFTNDYGMDIESLKTLRITKDTLKANCYIVRFTTTNSDASGKPVKQNVTLHISVIKDRDSYKIDEIN